MLARWVLLTFSIVGAPKQAPLHGRPRAITQDGWGNHAGLPLRGRTERTPPRGRTDTDQQISTRPRTAALRPLSARSCPPFGHARRCGALYQSLWFLLAVCAARPDAGAAFAVRGSQRETRRAHSRLGRRFGPGMDVEKRPACGETSVLWQGACRQAGLDFAQDAARCSRRDGDPRRRARVCGGRVTARRETRV